MYTRPIEEEPGSFVKNNKPVFGTFSGHPKRMDIRGVRRPYGILPLPTFITNLRIKSQVGFYFSVGEFIGFIGFFDAKIIGLAEVVFWNTETKQRFAYHNVMPPRKRFVPHDLNLAATSSYRKARYIRISWDRKHDKLSVVFNLKGKDGRPNARGALLSNFSSSVTGELSTVSPAPTKRRCSAEYVFTSSLKGALTTQYKHQEEKTSNNQEGFAFLAINRNYMRFHSEGQFVMGLGQVKGKNISFRIIDTDHDAVDEDKYNHNVLFVDGQPTPLPPVVITHPFGVMNRWIIQDTENMVDLSFTPVSDNRKIINVIVFKTDYDGVYGTFEGTLMTKDGEKISFKSLPGIAKKYDIRL